MLEHLVDLAFPPGMFYKGTPRLSKGRWYQGSLVRFFQGNIRPIGGWVQRTLTGATISGTPNAAVSWLLNDGTAWLAIGTTTNLYVVSSANVVYNITPVTGLFSAPPYIWQLDLFGSYLIATYNAPSIAAPDNTAVNFYAWLGDPAIAATLTRGTAADTGTAEISSVLTAPQAVFGVVTTPERFLFLLRGESPTQTYGTTDTDTTPDYSNRRVYWPSQEAIFDFRPADVNTAGSFDLSTDGTLMCGKPSRGQTLIWSTTDVWAASYIGGTLVWRFDRVATNCGIMSHHAAVVLDTGTYWMGANQKFFVYDGFTKSIDCDVSDYVFGSFNAAQAAKVWALANPAFSEITWFYPSAAATDPDRYVTYNYQEQHWAFGSLQRSIGVTQFAGATTPVPVMLDSAGHIYDHETGNARGSSSSVFLESGPAEIGAGDQVMRLQQIVPDDKTLGDVTLSLYTSFFPDQIETLNGPYTSANPTSIRLTARQARLRIVEATASAWRVGLIRIGMILGGRR